MNELFCNVGEYGIILNQQDEFLILKLSAGNGFPEEKRMLPGGRLDENDEPEAGLQREVREETNLRIDIIAPVHVAKRGKKYSVFFLCRVIEEQEVKISNEHIESRWMKFNDSENIDRHNSNSKIAVEKARKLITK